MLSWNYKHQKIGESYPEKMYIQTPEELATNGAKISDNDEEKN